MFVHAEVVTFVHRLRYFVIGAVLQGPQRPGRGPLSMEEMMVTYVEGRGVASDVEPIGLVSEGAAGIAAIVLAVIALAGISAVVLASIVTIVIGVGLMAQAFNSAAESPAGVAGGQPREIGGEVMVDILTGIAGVILGVLALVGINAPHLVPAALVIFGGALLLSGALAMRPRSAAVPTGGGQVAVVVSQGAAAAGGMEIMIGIAGSCSASYR